MNEDGSKEIERMVAEEHRDSIRLPVNQASGMATATCGRPVDLTPYLEPGSLPPEAIFSVLREHRLINNRAVL